MKKLEINDPITIRQANGKAQVRISIGDSMYFDSPETTYDNAKAILTNLENRLE